MSKPTHYGAKYWAISGDGETIYLCADRLVVLPSGALVAIGGYREDGAETTSDPSVIYGIAAGQWQTFFAASCISGEMVAAHDF